LKVADLIIKFLEKAHLDLMFGIPGSQTCPLYDSLYSSSIRHILVRHEQSASYMADAYAKFTGKLEYAMNRRTWRNKSFNWYCHSMD